jgi:uncharacterized membrane protein
MTESPTTGSGTPGAWFVHTKGAPDDAPFEIAVLRTSNAHGIASFGWFGADKFLISHSGGPCRDTVPPAVWSELVGIAERIADRLNAAAACEALGLADKVLAAQEPDQREARRHLAAAFKALTLGVKGL